MKMKSSKAQRLKSQGRIALKELDESGMMQIADTMTGRNDKAESMRWFARKKERGQEVFFFFKEVIGQSGDFGAGFPGQERLGGASTQCTAYCDDACHSATGNTCCVLVTWCACVDVCNCIRLFRLVHMRLCGLLLGRLQAVCRPSRVRGSSDSTAMKKACQ